MPEGLEQYSDQELLDELQRRGGNPFGRCSTCKRWVTYMGIWDRDGYTLRCRGCLRSVANCTCR